MDTDNNTPLSLNAEASENGVLQQLQPAEEELAAHKSEGVPNSSPTIEELQQNFQSSVILKEIEAVETSAEEVGDKSIVPPCNGSASFKKASGQLKNGKPSSTGNPVVSGAKKDKDGKPDGTMPSKALAKQPTALGAKGNSVNERKASERNTNLVPSSLKSNDHSKQTDKTSSPSGPQPESLKLKLLPECGQTFKLEGFPQYVARQMGFSDKRECPTLCKLASEYIIRAHGCEEEIYNFFANEPAADSLFIKLLEEFERLILSYFAFHWSQASNMISQALVSADKSPETKKKLKFFVMEATRQRRFERVTKNLKVTREFNTLVEEMKAIGVVAADDSRCTDVIFPMAHNDRSPVLLFMGGGMGAGKSTVLKDILKEPFWVEAKGNAVVIEADAFKESDVIYKALSSRGHHHDMLQTAELVHKSSTDAASSLLVTALNEGRDVIMDGTLSWLPFVVQTIMMARNIHRRRYRMGPGYRVEEDGSVTENYWEIAEEQDLMDGNIKRRAYRIELVGVVCDAYLAVIRGIRRAIMSRRAVRVNSQLKSHKRFANAFTTYCNLVDVARLYSTNDIEGPAKLIGWKEKDKTLQVDAEEIKVLNAVGRLNEEADSIYELYNHPNPAMEPGSVWKDIVLSPSRLNTQKELKSAIHKIETSSSPPHH